MPLARLVAAPQTISYVPPGGGYLIGGAAEAPRGPLGLGGRKPAAAAHVPGAEEEERRMAYFKQVRWVDTHVPTHVVMRSVVSLGAPVADKRRRDAAVSNAWSSAVAVDLRERGRGPARVEAPLLCHRPCRSSACAARLRASRPRSTLSAASASPDGMARLRRAAAAAALEPVRHAPPRPLKPQLCSLPGQTKLESRAGCATVLCRFNLKGGDTAVLAMSAPFTVQVSAGQPWQKGSVWASLPHACTRHALGRRRPHGVCECAVVGP
jgi:hypothetical protein